MKRKNRRSWNKWDVRASETLLIFLDNRNTIVLVNRYRNQVMLLQFNLQTIILTNTIAYET